MMRSFFNISFFVLLLLLNFRGSIGYFLRFGDPNSSPTYFERPNYFFLIWDVLIVLLLLIMLLNTRKVLKKYFLYYLVIVVFLFINLTQTESFYIIGAARSIILCGFVFIIIASNPYWIELAYINKAIVIMAITGLLFLCFQFIQYELFGILPANSHQGQLIRYGAFYDDCLVLGTLLPMFTGYFFRKFQKSNLKLLIVIFASFIISYSTGGLTTLAVMVLYLIWLVRCMQSRLIPFAILGILSTIWFLMDNFVGMWSFKSGSIAAHLSGIHNLYKLEYLTIIGLHPLSIFVESGYLDILFNFGVPVLIIFLFFHLFIFVCCQKVLKKNGSNNELYMLAGATEGLIVSVAITNLNLAPFVYPPVYLMVAIFSGIIAGYISTFKDEKTMYLRTALSSLRNQKRIQLEKASAKPLR